MTFNSNIQLEMKIHRRKHIHHNSQYSPYNYFLSGFCGRIGYNWSFGLEEDDYSTTEETGH